MRSHSKLGVDNFDPDAKLEMIRLYETGRWSMRVIARHFGTGREAVSAIIRAYKPTQQLAERHLQANALQLAERLTTTVKNPQDIADILSRPNIGALKPHQRENGAPQILMSITQTSLGGVIDVAPSAGELYHQPGHVGPGEAVHPPVPVPLATVGRLGLPPRRVAPKGPRTHKDGTPATVINGRTLRPDEERRHRQGQKRSKIHLSDPPDHFPVD